MAGMNSPFETTCVGIGEVERAACRAQRRARAGPGHDKKTRRESGPHVDRSETKLIDSRKLRTLDSRGGEA
jgi:hypothetical protein